MNKNEMLALALVVVIGLGSVYFLGHDNFVEETTEEVVKGHTGMDIDLTPSSPESYEDIH